MAKKRFNNWYLLIILVVLAGTFYLLQQNKTRKAERTFDTGFISLDTAEVDQILLYVKAENHEEIRLFRDGGTWKVSKGAITANAQPFRAKGIIAELVSIKPLRLAAKGKNRWEEYQVTDSLATRVKVLDQSGKTVMDLMIGKLSFLQNPQQPAGFGGGNNAKGISYIRMTDENEVYAVDGYLPMTFNQNFSSWRDGTFLKSNKDDITRLSYSYPADSGYILNRVDTVWKIGDEIADAEKVQNLLAVLANRNNNSFDDTFKPSSNPEYTLTIEGNNMNPITIQAYRRSPTEVVMHSSLNPDSYVVSTPTGLFKDVFRGKRALM